MIATLTMNPCVDHTVTLRGLLIGGTNRAVSSRRDPAGKGINVGIALRQMGEAVECLCLSHRDGILRDFLRERGIPAGLVDAPGEVRVNVKLFDEETRVMTEVNDKGTPLPPEVLAAVTELVCSRLPELELLVLTGSTPPGVPETYYRDLALLAKDAGVPTVIDAGGSALLRGAEAGPLLIKPNRDELKSAFGMDVSPSPEETAASLRTLGKQYGIAYILLSMGAEGAMLSDGERAWYTKGAPVTVRGIQGAGDSLVAGFCAGYRQGVRDGGELLRRAVAAAGASLEKPGSQMCGREDTAEKYRQTIVQQL